MSNLVDQLEQMRGALASSDERPESQLTQQIEQMRRRMMEVAKREHHMAAELDAVVRRMDEQLLQDVRSIAAAHETRRANILHELQMLATKMRDRTEPDRPPHRLGTHAFPLPSPAQSESGQRLLDRNDQHRAVQEALSSYIGQRRLSS